jgi:hypothetical protein
MDHARRVIGERLKDRRISNRQDKVALPSYFARAVWAQQQMRAERLCRDVYFGRGMRCTAGRGVAALLIRPRRPRLLPGSSYDAVLGSKSCLNGLGQCRLMWPASA